MLRTAGAPPGLKVVKPGAATRSQLSGREAEEVRVRTRQVLLALGMLVAGTANTVTCKAALSTVSLNAPFNHPFVMSGCMFCGEIMCLVWHNCQAAFRQRRRRMLGLEVSGPSGGATGQAGGDRQAREDAAVPKHIFALPALCDILGTSVMYVGLTLTTASTYQMLRGSVIIFTGVLSATYLRRKQWAHHWVAMLLVFAGVLTVGTASTAMAAADADSSQGDGSLGSGGSGGSGSGGSGQPASSHARGQALLGSVLVVASQLFTALQMCLEERFVTGYDLPAVRPTLPRCRAASCGHRNATGGFSASTSLRPPSVCPTPPSLPPCMPPAHPSPLPVASPACGIPCLWHPLPVASPACASPACASPACASPA